jgi:predicted DNA-binding protein with PD1-like motif
VEALPLRLHPGDDLGCKLEAMAQDVGSAFVVCGVGSLDGVRIRLADERDELHLDGPFELLSLSGSISAGGAHLHMSVADATGRVIGGHVCRGNIVRTTAELLLARVTGWTLDRAHDSATGYDELVVLRDGSDRDGRPSGN